MSVEHRAAPTTNTAGIFAPLQTSMIEPHPTPEAATRAPSPRGDVLAEGAHLRIGVIVLNWNGHVDTVKCLDSLLAAPPEPARIVVVDNHSQDQSIPRLIEWANLQDMKLELRDDVKETSSKTSQVGTRPVVTLISSSYNRGFAGGNNLGLAYLAELPEITWFFLLNNDATVAPDFFRTLGKVLEEVPDVDLLGSTIFESENEQRVWYAGGRLNPLTANAVHRRVVPRRTHAVPTEFVTGCAMLISRAAYRVLGPLPECYFPIYQEDVEYSYRASRRGLTVSYAPSLTVYHKIGGTVGPAKASPRITHAQNRHRGVFARRNLTGATKAAALGYLAVVRPVRAALELLAGRPTIAWAVLRGTVAGFFCRLK